MVKAKFHYAIQLASWFATSSRPNSITLSSSRAGLRPARELDSVMKFGFNYKLLFRSSIYFVLTHFRH